MQNFVLFFLGHHIIAVALSVVDPNRFIGICGREKCYIDNMNY